MVISLDAFSAEKESLLRNELSSNVHRDTFREICVDQVFDQASSSYGGLGYLNACYSKISITYIILPRPPRAFGERPPRFSWARYIRDNVTTELRAPGDYTYG